MQLIVAGIGTLLFGLMLTPLVRAMARKRGIVAAPRQDRWHQQPTAMMGGVAIYLAFLAGYLIFWPRAGGARLILAAGTLLFIIGLLDDFLRIKPYIKLVAQLVVAAVVVYLGRRLPWTNYETVNIFITILWLVGITNAINLLDNMDGLAGGISGIACVFLATTFLLNGQTAQAMLPVLVGGAALGFLVFNFKPATIFMGDCGSMFLGFTLGAMALLSEYDRTRHIGSVLVTPVLILMIPILDTCVVTVTRKLAGRPISQGGRDHTSHRLVALGISERRAVLLLYSLAAVSGLLALLVRGMSWDMLLWLIPSFALIILFIGLYLAKVHIYEAEEVGQGRVGSTTGNTILNALTDFSYKRRVFEILLDMLLVALAYHGAYLLLFDGRITAGQVGSLLRTLPLVIAVQTLFFLLGGVYRGLWHYIDEEELVAMAKSVLGGTLVSAAVVFAISGWQIPSRAVFVLYALLLFVFVAASRFSFRLLRALIVGRQTQAAVDSNVKPVLIYGAGDRGKLLVRELLDNAECNYAPIGFIDDDPGKRGKRLHGFRIFNTSELPDLIGHYNVGEVLVSTMKVQENKLSYLRNLGVKIGRMSIRIETDPEAILAQDLTLGAGKRLPIALNTKLESV